MNEFFFEQILNSLDYPIEVVDKDNVVVFCNCAFHKLSDTQKTELFSKEIIINDERFTLRTAQTSSNQAHQDFISTISHELRTPLTSIRGFADTMLMAADKLSTEQQNKFLTIIRNQSDRLTRLVENMLEVSNMSKNSKPIFKEVNFNNFITPVITIFERKYPKQKYELLLEKNLPEILADTDILEQIMTNLIDNASKYSEEGSTITIKAEYFNNSVFVKVIDEAVKIPENQLENIFNKFSRIDNPLTRKVEGSGLGLFITKSLTNKINAKIKAENYENGNVFILELQPCNVEKQLKTKISGDKM